MHKVNSAVVGRLTASLISLLLLLLLFCCNIDCYYACTATALCVLLF
jgi:phage gp36-like protein